jgi:hypothetical protein
MRDPVCELTSIKKEWCAHCRGKSLTDEEQDAKDLDDMIARFANEGNPNRPAKQG